MMLSHISFALGLIALVSGVALYLWSVRAEAGAGITLAKIIGVIVIVLAILELACTLYSGLRWKHFQKDMMNGGCHCPMANNAPTSFAPPANNPAASGDTSMNAAPAALPIANSSTQS